MAAQDPDSSEPEVQSTNVPEKRASNATDIADILISAIKVTAITGLSVGGTLALAMAVDPENSKARGELSREAVISAASLATLLVGNITFPPIRALFFSKHSIQQSASTEDKAHEVDNTWRESLAKHGRAHLRPAVAWPTIAIALAGLFLWFGSAWAGHTERLAYPVAALGCTIGIFICFTPMHDASHGSIVPRSRLANDAVGYLAALPFLLQYRGFRHIHLAHHAHLNHPTKDPDHWAGSGPVVLLPIRWFTVFYNYAAYSFERSLDKTDVRAAHWRRMVFLDFSILPGLYVTVLWWRWEQAAVLYWLLPFMASTTWLMYVFDYLPHRPHVSLDKYLATSVTTGVPSPYLAVLLLSQNLHNIHHLVPTIPFYRYSVVWECSREELVRRGTRQLPWLLMPSREAHLAELRTKSE